MTFDDPEARVTVCGQEILLDGRHLADARDPAAAAALARALHYNGARWIPSEDEDVIMELLA